MTQLKTRLKHIKRLSPIRQWDIAAELCGHFRYADGFAELVYAHGASHAMNRRCEPVGRGDHSAHLHLGLLGAGGPYPHVWDDGLCFCAQASTRDRAITKALKLAGLL